ncbi:hypothetical protein LOCC1_G002648 [Lachnellula occidentalis]|uniref:Large ribosomal subunit protein mL50 n=1 Tax=Lachnellula occidentalis TaxID=215460 RepID=A0A8H8S5U4_9HELO|nr:hypothetical protein LOCC1_G002648 [Lachnellula occidentalis]
MRRIPITSRSIGLLRPYTTPTPYLCSICKHQAPAFSTSSLRPSLDTTEKIRRKVWGTDEPPGLEDPYGGLSKFAKKPKPTSPPRQMTAAPQLPPDYVPSSTWDGLESVGEIYEPEYDFGGFLPAELVTDTDEMTAALHRAMVEIFALKEAGLSLLNIPKAVLGLDPTHDVDIVPSADGTQLRFNKDSSLAEVLQALTRDVSLSSVDETAEKGAPTEAEEDVAADRSELDPLHPEGNSPLTDETAVKEQPTESEEDVAADRSEADPLADSEAYMPFEELIASWDPSWLQVSIEDPEIKFAILKRTLQLTGVRVPDSAIRSTRTAQSILSHLVTPPKPRKLIDALEQKEELLTLPNVSVFAKRVTPIHKEKSIGRWKLIEKELESRDLPVTATANNEYPEVCSTSATLPETAGETAFVAEDEILIVVGVGLWLALTAKVVELMLEFVPEELVGPEMGFELEMLR